MISFAMGTTYLPDRMKRFLRLFLAVIAMLCAVTGGTAMAAGKKVALIIGNSTYQFGERLTNPGNDADRVAQAARQAGFDVMILKDLGQMQFKASLREFRTKADGAEVALLYYAGHGIEKDNANYLIPIDAKLADPIDLRDEGIDLALVIDNMSKAERRVILLDACRDNPFRNRWSDATRSFFKNGLGEMQLPFNSLVVFATAAGMKAPDGDAGGNSSFAVVLANQIVKPGLALQDFGPAVMDEVKKATGGQQVPYYLPTLDSTKAYLVPPLADPGNGLSNDDVDWFNAQNARTAKAMRDYLLKYPQGKHVATATDMYRLFLDMERSAAKPVLGQATTPAAEAPVPQPTAEVITQQRPEPAPNYGTAPVATQPTEQSAQVVQQPSAPVYGPETPPITSNPASQPQPQPAPVFTPQQQTQTTVGSVNLDPATSGNSVSRPGDENASKTKYVDLGGTTRDLAPLPAVPDSPKFSSDNYPACKQKWLAESDVLKRPYVVNDCINEYNKFNNYYISYRESMNFYLNGIYGIIQKVQYSSQFTESTKNSFVEKLQALHKGGQDDGYLMVDYRKSMSDWQKDYTELKDSFNRATGCGGYPTPQGFAPCGK
jgi:hypothetical protein